MIPERGSCSDECQGAIAQLGERLHGMQEVGGSIPPGSTTLRPSGYAWRSHDGARRAKRGVRRSPKGEDGLVRPPLTTAQTDCPDASRQCGTSTSSAASNSPTKNTLARRKI